MGALETHSTVRSLLKTQAGVAALLMGLSANVSAQEGKQKDDNEANDKAVDASGQRIEEIIVTGYQVDRTTAPTRFELSFLQTPRSVSVLTSAFINDANLENAIRALDYAAGVSFQGQFGSRQTFSIRGFDSAIFGGTRLDGMRYTTRTQSLNDELIN